MKCFLAAYFHSGKIILKNWSVKKTQYTVKPDQTNRHETIEINKYQYFTPTSAYWNIRLYFEFEISFDTL